MHVAYIQYYACNLYPMSNLDLSLIRVLCAVYETRSASRAAQALSMTQPAVSYALSRLRSVMTNPLFVRSQNGMIPTALADHLYEEFRRSLDIIDGTMTSVAKFVPANSDRQFRIAMTDIGEMIFLPPLIQYLRREAPGVRIEVYQGTPTETPHALATGQLDFAVGYLPGILFRTSDVEVFTERYVCAFREKHSIIGKKLSLRAFTACQHVVVSSIFNSHNQVSEGLLARGVRRTIALQVSHFTSLPTILAETDLVAVVPSRVAKFWVSKHRLKYLPIPVSLPGIVVRVHWDRRFHLDRGHSWMRTAIINTISKL
jgi:DNA-binding transcriptional LysR family regulator